MTSKPSTFGSFRSKRTTLRYKICVPTRAFPHTKKILKSFSAIVRNNDFIPDIVLLQGPRRECFVVRVVFNQQNRLIFHDPLHEWIPSQSKIKRRALRDLSFRPYLPTMSVYAMKSDTGTAKRGLYKCGLLNVCSFFGNKNWLSFGPGFQWFAQPVYDPISS